MLINELYSLKDARLKFSYSNSIKLFVRANLFDNSYNTKKFRSEDIRGGPFSIHRTASACGPEQQCICTLSVTKNMGTHTALLENWDNQPKSEPHSPGGYPATSRAGAACHMKLWDSVYF